MGDSLAIVIPTCNRHDQLRGCLDALHPQVEALKVEGVSIDVLITDDGSASANSLVSSFPWARWVAGPRAGRSANRNAGARRVSGAWIAFLDDDVIPEDKWLKAYLNRIASRSADVFEGRVIADRQRRAFNEICPLNLEGGALWSCNFAVRRSVFEAVGGFDETYVRPGLEDTDLRLRLEAYGAQTVFIPEATVCHPWRKTDLREMLARFGNMDMFLDRHPSEAASYNSQRFARGVGFTLKVLCRDIMKYRARGAGFQVGGAAIAGIISLRLWRRSRAIVKVR